MASTDMGQSFLDAKAHNPQNIHAQGHAHVVSPKTLLAVFGGLMVLTVITVAITWVPMGPFNIWAALLIALIKGALVAMYFMHLKWDNPFNGLILIAALFFVTLFIGITILDSREYKSNYSKPGPGQSIAMPAQ